MTEMLYPSRFFDYKQMFVVFLKTLQISDGRLTNCKKKIPMGKQSGSDNRGHHNVLGSKIEE